MASTQAEPEAAASATVDASRRTWLAAERTWLAWWRTGVGVAAVAIGVGRLVPAVTHGSRWPFRAVGIGYGLVAVVVLLIGAVRQRETAKALRHGTYAELSGPVVMWLTAASVLLSIAAIALVAVRF